MATKIVNLSNSEFPVFLVNKIQSELANLIKIALALEQLFKYNPQRTIKVYDSVLFDFEYGLSKMIKMLVSELSDNQELAAKLNSYDNFSACDKNDMIRMGIMLVKDIYFVLFTRPNCIDMGSVNTIEEQLATSKRQFDWKIQLLHEMLQDVASASIDIDTVMLISSQLIILRKDMVSEIVESFQDHIQKLEIEHKQVLSIDTC